MTATVNGFAPRASAERSRGDCARRLSLAALLALVVGCESGDPWLVKREQKQPGPWVVKPSERMASLERVARDVKSATPEQQARVAQQLADALPAEPDPLIRIEMVKTLSAFPGDVATRAIAAALEDGDEGVRMAACSAIAKRDAATAVPALGKIASDDADTDVRLAATRALGETRDPSAVAALGTVLEQSDPAMQYRAMESLKQVSGRNFGHDVAAWREYAQGREPETGSESLMARVRDWFR